MIRWITERLGTSAWEELDGTEGVAVVDVRDLVDREGNPTALVKRKLEEGTERLSRGERVVVCCDYGISRSNAVAAGILARHAGVSFEEALRLVMRAAGHAAPRLDVLSAVRKALGAELPTPQAAPLGTRLLITGASGFIGSALRSQLPGGLGIHPLGPDRDELDLAADAVELDLWLRRHRPHAILHLAKPRDFGTNASLGTALVMLKNVLDACAEHGLWLVLLSSWEVYAGHAGGPVRADEDLDSRPSGTTGQIKLLSEVLVGQHAGRHRFPATIVRPGTVYGPGPRPRFLRSFLEKARRGEEIVTHRYREGPPRLDLLHVDDLCRALLAILRSKAEGSFNVGTGVATSTIELAQRLVSLVGSPSQVRVQEIEASGSHVVMDSNRIRSQLGWAPQIDLARGLASVVAGSPLPSKEDRDECRA